MMRTTIRLESPEDRPGVRQVNELAFGQSAEADIIDRLRLASPIPCRWWRRMARWWGTFSLRRSWSRARREM